MNNIINRNFRKDYNNQYRHGVLIGNFAEDIIGEDLKLKHDNEYVDKKYFVTETKEQFIWPQLKDNHVKNPGNDLTLKCNSNFDLNIDFNAKNIEDYLKLQGVNEFELKDKNVFLPSQLKAENSARKLEENRTGFIETNTINRETQNMLKNFHQQDANGLLFTKKSGLVKNLFFGHGMDQRKFENNEYASTYQ